MSAQILQRYVQEDYVHAYLTSTKAWINAVSTISHSFAYIIFSSCRMFSKKCRTPVNSYQYLPMTFVSLVIWICMGSTDNWKKIGTMTWKNFHLHALSHGYYILKSQYTSIIGKPKKYALEIRHQSPDDIGDQMSNTCFPWLLKMAILSKL